jgi:hypothetical protein
MNKRLSAPILSPKPVRVAVCRLSLTNFVDPQFDALVSSLSFLDQTRVPSQNEAFAYNDRIWNLETRHSDGRVTGILSRTKLTISSHLVTIFTVKSEMPLTNCLLSFDAWQERLGSS